MSTSNALRTDTRRITTMDLLVITSLIVGGLAALALASGRWGIDSRDLIADDHRR